VPKQFKLFEVRDAYRVEQPKQVMSHKDLIKWKQRIFLAQQRALATKPVQQTSLFDPPKSHCDYELINPFQLKLHSSTFYRSPQPEERICIYFIIDRAVPILLYVGETMQTAKP
jgi:hypothetical protein